MKWWQVECTLEGIGTEKLLNGARSRGILFGRVMRRRDRVICLRLSPRHYRMLDSLAREKGYSLSPARPLGLLRLLRLARRRWGLFAGMLAGILVMCWSLGLIWQVQIENAGPYLGEVRMFLEEMGVRPGIARDSVALPALQQQLAWRLPQVKWVRLEYAGVNLRVRLEQGTPPPDILSHQGSGDLIAQEDGVLLRLTAHAGTPAAKEGQLVRAGQVLIRGEEKGSNGQIVSVQARGEAIARVWRTWEAKAGLTEMTTIPTGRTYDRFVICTPFFSWSPQDTPDYLAWDMEKQSQKASAGWLPIWVEREQYLEAALEENPRDEREAKAEAAQLAYLSMQRALINENIVDKWIDFRMIEGDTIVAAVTAEIHRDIGCRKKN